MPIPRNHPPKRRRRWSKRAWRPEYLPAAIRIFTPFDPCKNYPKGRYHLVNKDAITAEEVTDRIGGEL